MKLAWRLTVFCTVLFAAMAAVLWPWPDLSMLLIGSEKGFIELTTVAIALWAAWEAARIVRRRRALPHPALTAWFGLFVIGLIFLAGEEASWGQSWFGWATPEDYARKNLQQETNLHNLSLAAEALPKTLLTLACLAGGIVWPIYASTKKLPPVLGGWFGILWPAAYLWPPAAMTWVARVAERILVWTNWEDFVPGLYRATRESLELYAVIFILAYLVDIRGRIDTAASPGAPARLD